MDGDCLPVFVIAAQPGLSIGPVVPQSSDEGTHFFLTISNRAFQPLAPLFLPNLGLLLLLFPALQQLIVQQLCARQQSSSIFSGGLLTLALLLETADHTVDLPLRCWCQQLLGLIEHVGVKPKTGGNRQSIAAPGDTPKQVVGRRKGLSVEGHRSILEPRVAVFESLQLTEMRGGDRESGAVGECLEQGGCESCSLTGIRTSPNLVQKNESRGRS